jgi:hypothetical protein
MLSGVFRALCCPFVRPFFQSSDVIEPPSLKRQELLGEGAFGRVYKGLLHGSTVVAGTHIQNARVCVRALACVGQRVGERE